MSRYIDAGLIDFSRLNNDFDRARAKIIIMGQPTADVEEVRHGDMYAPLVTTFTTIKGTSIAPTAVQKWTA